MENHVENKEHAKRTASSHDELIPELTESDSDNFKGVVRLNKERVT